MTEIVRYELRDGVAVLAFDDGRANAVSHAAIDALNGSLGRAEKEAGAAVLLGRPGRFSAGFDLSVINQGIDASRALVTAGGELLVRILESDVPVVAACSGHALAMGALMLLASDYRVGARGAFKIGLNEVAIGLTLPVFALELARARIAREHLARATNLAEVYDPDGALAAGYLDRVVAPEQLEAEALAAAQPLTKLNRAAYRGTKRKLFGPMMQHVRATLAQDMASWTTP
ncbi:MAG: crotonase/enoyl-CoA hydratase family protein [Deltaproteobacteria bacterium]|nr:crotonase/enoyl-CoA hydratase family protein [Deltaproteobacteria bacterium]